MVRCRSPSSSLFLNVMANWSIWKCIVWKCKFLDLARHKMRVFDRLHGKSYWKHFLWWDVFFIHLFMTRYITLDISRSFQTWYNFLQSIYYRWVRPYIGNKIIPFHYQADYVFFYFLQCDDGNDVDERLSIQSHIL